MAHVMLSVGHAFAGTLRETAKGGIAQAPAALSACAKMRRVRITAKNDSKVGQMSHSFECHRFRTTNSRAIAIMQAQ